MTALTLVGCASDDTTGSAPAQDSPPPALTEQPEESNDAGGDDAANGTDGSGTAEISFGDTTYTAELASCILQGGEEALFHGPAHDESGSAIGYLTGDFGNLTDVPHGEMRMNIGATEQFDSTDEFIAMGDSVGQIVITASDESELMVVGGVWDHNGEQLGTGTLTVEC